MYVVHCPLIGDAPYLLTASHIRVPCTAASVARVVINDPWHGPGVLAGEYSAGRAQFDTNVANALQGRSYRERLQVTAGWFNETLPASQVKRIAFLRLDGDLYVSTMDALQALYDKVAPGG